MSTRQYIGARYVPLIAGDWDNSNTYDPLTIVMYQGNSYTSRTYVPAGIDISNTTYWALTGNYNAQVEAYRQEVLNYTNTVDNTLSNILAGKVCAFFGDSTTAGFVSDSGSPVLEPTESYPYKFGELTKATVYNYGQGGATMTNLSAYPVNEYSFSLQIDKCNTEVGVANLDYAFINFGINDAGQDADIGTCKIVNEIYLDESRFIDAFYLGLKKLYTLNNKLTVIVILPDYTSRELADLSTAQNNIGLNVEDYRNALVNYANIMRLSVVDFRKCGVNLLNYTVYHNNDPFHLTRFGYTIQAYYLAKNWNEKVLGNLENRQRLQRNTYPLVGANFFAGTHQNYTTNYVNGVAFGLTVGNSVTSQETVFLQAGDYIISSTMRGFVANDITVEILDASDNSTVYTNSAHIVEFDSYVWMLHVDSNILSAKVKITNEATSEGNLIVGNFDIRPLGDMYSPRRALNSITWTALNEHVSIEGTQVSLLENKKLHIALDLYNDDANNQSGILFETDTITSIARAQLLIGYDSTDSAFVPVNFYVSNGKLVINCLVKAGHHVFVNGEIFLGDNSTAYDVIC